MSRSPRSGQRVFRGNRSARKNLTLVDSPTLTARTPAACHPDLAKREKDQKKMVAARSTVCILLAEEGRTRDQTGSSNGQECLFPRSDFA